MACFVNYGVKIIFYGFKCSVSFCFWLFWSVWLILEIVVGMLPPFGVESEETRVMARHSTVGIEPRVSSERIILLDTQVISHVKIYCKWMCSLYFVGMSCE